MTVKCLAIVLGAMTGIPLWGQPHTQAQFALTERQVARCISGQGINISDDQVSLLAKVVATESHPLLDILSVAPFNGRLSTEHSKAQSLVKLGCRLRAVCLPFYVVITGDEGNAGSEAAGTAIVPARLRVGTSPAITMRSGTHAVLQMDDNRSRVQVTVISLEDGKSGDKIRVASLDHKQIYTAEVIGANLLTRSY